MSRQSNRTDQTDRSDRPLVIRPFVNGDADAVVAVWDACGLTRFWNHPGRDIERKLAIDREGLLVGVIDTVVVATVMAGYDGHRGWINYLGVHPEHRGGGLGEAMMRAAESLLASRGCAKVNLQIRTSNSAAVRFYESIGYSLDDVVSMGRRLIDDTPDEHPGT